MRAANGRVRQHAGNLSRNLFAHIDNNALLYFETLNQSRSLFMNAMRIPPLQTLRVSAVADPAQPPLNVALRIDLKQWAAAAEHTLTVELDPECVKQFRFLPGEQAVGIPLSTRRPTSVSIRCFNDDVEIPEHEVKSCLLDKSTNSRTPVLGATTLRWSADTHVFCTVMQHAQTKLSFILPCYAYEHDSPSGSCFTGYDVDSLYRDFHTMLATPCMTPSDKLSVLTSDEAEFRLSKCENLIQVLHTFFHDTFLATAQHELGAAPDAAARVASTVDWRRSFTTRSDDSVANLIRVTKDLHLSLARLSNAMVAGDWLQQAALGLAPAQGQDQAPAQQMAQAVARLVQTRRKLALNVQGRRSDQREVLHVRTSFLCISAIDDALRHVCSHGDQTDATAEDQALHNRSCHRYWLSQFQANTHNSVQIHPETFQDACGILAECETVKGYGIHLLPHSAALASSIGYRVWQSMHLQGIAADHDLPVAPCAHFLYKNRARIDYTKHPVPMALQAQILQAGDDECRQRLLQQIASATLLTMLVNTDVEHRIIPSKLGTRILGLLYTATSPDTTQAAKEAAHASLACVLDPKLHSLAASAVGNDASPDLTFITNAANEPCITGYNMEEVTSHCLAVLMNVTEI